MQTHNRMHDGEHTTPAASHEGHGGGKASHEHGGHGHGGHHGHGDHAAMFRSRLLERVW